jgi:hypothetical protein
MNMEEYRKKLSDLMDAKAKKDSNQDMESDSQDSFAAMFAQAEASLEIFEREFDSMSEKYGSERNLLYGEEEMKEDRMIEAREFLKDRVLESMISENMAKDLGDFSVPKFENITVCLSVYSTDIGLCWG